MMEKKLGIGPHTVPMGARIFGKAIALAVIVPMSTIFPLMMQGKGEGAIYLSLGFLVMCFYLINYGFIFDFKFMFTEPQYLRDIFRYFIVVAINGLSNIIWFSTLYYLFGVNNGGNVIKKSVVDSLYFSIVTWTTLGYGDFSPIPELRLVAALEALMGYTYMALMVGLLLILGQQSMRIKPDIVTPVENSFHPDDAY